MNDTQNPNPNKARPFLKKATDSGTSPFPDPELTLARHALIAKTNGVKVGKGEYLFAHITLYSSKRGIIRSTEPDYQKKREQWEKAKDDATKSLDGK